MINRERLADTFISLAKIDSVSKEEAVMCEELDRRLTAMGAETLTDNAGRAVGGNSGNLVAFFEGNTRASPLLFNAHMDTVEPGRGILPKRSGDIITSDGSTILGADDKTGVAILLEAMQVIQENRLPSGPIEYVFTICQEIGLLGAKHLDYGNVSARFGYSLDAYSSSDPGMESLIIRTPAANRFTFVVHGREAHAGAAPEEGINAIAIASRAIAGLQIGRIDHETTCNIGRISGGSSTTKVPDVAIVMGEVRSFDDEKLKNITSNIAAVFRAAVKQGSIQAAAPHSPRLDEDVTSDYPALKIQPDHYVIHLARRAAARLGKTLFVQTAPSGEDANIFTSKGIVTAILGTGMHNVHHPSESANLAEMVRTTELIIELVRLHSQRLET